MDAKIIAFPKARRSQLSLAAIRAIEAVVRIDARYRETGLEADATRELDRLVVALEALATRESAD
jgi:hypothetical protein